MLFIVYGILLIGGMWVVGLAFVSPILPGLVFIAGILLIAAAVAVPITAAAFESDRPRNR